MWKKDEMTPDLHPTAVTTTPSRSDVPPVASPSRARASIGTSITIRGEVTGDEDLLIEGRIDGSVDLKQHSVTVGAEGQVKAGITGRVVTVEGTVHGDLRADEMVVLRSTAHVQGDITAPRVVLEDGASFRGAVDMGDKVASPPRGNVRTSSDKSPSVQGTKANTGADAAPSAKDAAGAGLSNARAVGR